MLHLNTQGLRDTAAWEKAGIALPRYDVQAVRKRTWEKPAWVHFGAGNIFRGFLAAAQQTLLHTGAADTGIIAAESFDFQIIDNVYTPYDSLSLLVRMAADCPNQMEVIGSVAGGLKADCQGPDWDRLVKVFQSPTLQMASFTITEKGYALTGLKGDLLPVVERDLESGPDCPCHTMSIAAALLYRRFQTGGAPIAMVTAAEHVPQGHKLALVPLKPGDLVYKYGCAIGRVTTSVPAGGWVHTHNMTTNLSAHTDFSYRPMVQALEPEEPEQFLGCLRPDGRASTRNEIWILPTVGCVNEIANQLAADNQDLVGGSVEGLYAFPHPYGCSQTGADHANTRAILAGLARHPNAAAVLVVGLGCENLQCSQLMEDLGTASERVKFLVCQQVEDELAAGRALLEECAAYAAQFQRQPVPVSKLVVGLKCGGSDGLSGITANPVVGRFSDLLVARGGSTILTEVPEMFGAEELLLGRCADEEVFRQAAEMLQGFRDYFVSHGENVYENPSPGNKAGGITTLEDKSCGCVQKGGTAPIVGVVPYGGQVVRPGLNLLWGPGNDLVSTTALSAAGAHLILFTTGRGTPFGSPVPTLKIASNRTLAARKPGWIDFDAGVVAEGESIGQTARHLFHLVLRTAGGSCTKSEAAGYRGVAIFKDGVTL